MSLGRWDEGSEREGLREVKKGDSSLATSRKNRRQGIRGHEGENSTNMGPLL